MNETWFDVCGFEGLYKVSSLGNVRSLDRFSVNGLALEGKPSPFFYSKKGYSNVSMRINGKASNAQVHRLVALAYIPNPDNKPQVNHIDGNKSNNCVDNLEWCTNQENQLHARSTGLLVSAKGAKASKAKLSELEAQYAIWWMQAGMRVVDVANTLCVRPQTCDAIKQNKSWRHLSRS